MKEIKVRYKGNKCSDCGREMQVGWKAFFDVVNEKKFLYCTVCAKARIDGNKPTTTEQPEQKEQSVYNLEEIIGMVNMKLTVVIEELSRVIDILTSKPETKPAPKTASKSKK